MMRLNGADSETPNTWRCNWIGVDASKLWTMSVCVNTKAAGGNGWINQ